LLSGGKHAGEQVAIQDVLMVPMAPDSIDGSLVMAYDVYQAAAALVKQLHGMPALTADEGGLAPPAKTAEALIQTAVDAIDMAGYRPGIDMAIAVDIASSHFHSDQGYRLDGRLLSAREMVQQIENWISRFPIVSVEDGLAEDDWGNWPELNSTIGKRAQVVGDDLLCTNPLRIRRAIDEHACNTLLLKVNQIGTLTDAAQAHQLARSAGWKVVASARSGETEDNWLADLAVGWSADQIKVGSITQSERLAKYNRLLAIESETHWPSTPFPSF
jgi:enolase